MYSVYQHWDPLKVCAVGRSYPPEFYSWITIPHVRKLFEKIAIETEEDYQNIIRKLESFGVKIVRTDIPDEMNVYENGKFVKPPMCPRDHTIMVGDKFYISDQQPSTFNNYTSILNEVQSQGNSLITKYSDPDDSKYASNINGAMITRLGKDLYFGTNLDQDMVDYKIKMDIEFPDTRNHIINTEGHADGTFCAVTPGLIISLKDVPAQHRTGFPISFKDVPPYAEPFPDWEVIYLPNQNWAGIKPFLQLKRKNYGKWWIPGFEHDQSVVNVVETWLGHWTGYVEETVFDVNMLIVDPKNVIVFNYNKQVFDAFERYGITPHIVPFRHRYFWDGGVHCVTSDLHREGTMQDYFPERG